MVKLKKILPFLLVALISLQLNTTSLEAAHLKETTLGSITLNSCDADPSIDPFPANIGSTAFDETTGKVYIKWGVNDSDWNAISSNFASFVSATINGKTTGSTLIGTTRSNGGEKFYPQTAQVILVSTTGFATEPTISIGTNATDYNNIIASKTLTGLSSADHFYSLDLLGTVQPVIAGGTGLYVNVNTGATATTYVVVVLLRGFYA